MRARAKHSGPGHTSGAPATRARGGHDGNHVAHYHVGGVLDKPARGHDGNHVAYYHTFKRRCTGCTRRLRIVRARKETVMAAATAAWTPAHDALLKALSADGSIHRAAGATQAREFVGMMPAGAVNAHCPVSARALRPNRLAHARLMPPPRSRAPPPCSCSRSRATPSSRRSPTRDEGSW